MTVSPRVRWIVAWSVATALLIICARTIDWTHAATAIAMVSAGWIFAAIVANTLILVCWGAFWRTLTPDREPRAAYPRMFGIVSTASSLMNTVPFGGGHAASIALLSKRGGLSVRGSLAVLALDQLGEGLIKVATFLLVALVVPLPIWMRAGVTAASIGVAVWFVTLGVASRWRSELKLLHSVRRSLMAFGCVAAMKGAELLAIIAVQRAFGLDLAWSSSLLVLAAVLLGTMLPVAPGNLGTYEASVFLAYRYLGVAPDQALALAIVQHVAFMVPAVGVGYLFVSAQALARSAIASR